MDELVLRVDVGPEASDRQVEREVRNLHRDLRRLGLFQVGRRPAPAPFGSMASAGYELGVLVVSGAFSAAGLRALSNVLVAYIERSKARSVDWEFDGSRGSFQGMSAKHQRTLVEAVAARIAAGAGADGSAEPGGGDGGTPDRPADRD